MRLRKAETAVTTREKGTAKSRQRKYERMNKRIRKRSLVKKRKRENWQEN